MIKKMFKILISDLLKLLKYILCVGGIGYVALILIPFFIGKIILNILYHYEIITTHDNYDKWGYGFVVEVVLMLIICYIFNLLDRAKEKNV
jgi:hypothetical protein